MKILVIGNGAREHALAWKATQSSLSDSVFVAPGNAGTYLEKNIYNVPINSTDISSLIKFSQQEKVELVIVGPEAPLVMGIVDRFKSAGINIFGPTKSAAQLESSKLFAKNFLNRHNILTAKYKSFTDIKHALNYLYSQTFPIVIKADGLAAGKGVFIVKTIKEAESVIKNMLEKNIFGNACNSILIEDFLEGDEITFMVMVDGEYVLPMATTKDYKCIGEYNTGLNTGGMGAYSPVPIINDTMHQNIMQTIIYPTVRGMHLEGCSYTGILYAGLIINKLGQPILIEFNCRFGDPETQPMMLRLESDLIDLCLAASKGELHKKEVRWSSKCSIGVVLASKGYPNDHKIGYQINNIPKIENNNNIKIFHAGTCIKNNILTTNGGRVLCVTALGENMIVAKNNVYKMISSISWENIYFRRDIGSNIIMNND
ncbi:MAG: phosphoribosylamine--glycine ligase [Pantoea sp. Brub]|nr:phosphoribosylamine--glycine ligase [Pantoea sp. Brub]